MRTENIIMKTKIYNKIFTLLDSLEIIYHNEANPPDLGHTEPLDGLILTVLSQNTNDKNRDKAFLNLKNNFSTWQEVIDAGVDKLSEIIKTAGLANTKSKRIIHILNRIHNDFHEYSLKQFFGFKREFIVDYLRNLPGVGAKTVACVLLFDLKMKAFPVDTHVTRISKRFGIANENQSPEDISLIYEGIVPETRCLGGHVNIIVHGRKICHAQKPNCTECSLNTLCDFFNNNS